MSSRYVLVDKSVGVLAGAAVGDALGWPQEDRSQIVGGNAARDVSAEPQFRDWVRHGGGPYARYADPVQAGEYSDDTQLLLAVTRACLRDDDWYSWLTRVELPVWPTYQRGGGGAVLNASRAWAEGRPPWVPNNQRAEAKVARYYRAGANGVAMRIAPHAVATINNPVEDLLRRVVLDGLATHGHPRALIGACVHALATRHALQRDGTLEYGELFDAIEEEPAWRNPDLLTDAIDGEWVRNHAQFGEKTAGHPTEVWIATCREVERLLDIGVEMGLSRGATANDDKVLTEFGCFDKKQSGSGTVTAVAALYVTTRTAPRPMSGLMRTGFLRNADTDTLCSMTGSLLGAIQGPHWLGHLMFDVQDSEYLMRLGTDLAMAAISPGAPAEYSQVTPVATTTSDLRRWQDAMFARGDMHVSPDGRGMRILGFRELSTRTRNYVTRAVCETADGQSLYFDRVARNPAPVLERADHADAVMSDLPSSESPVDAGSTVGDDDARSADTVADDASSEPSPVAAEPHVVTIELRVQDLQTSMRFFEEVLGFQCRKRDGKAFFGPIFALTQSKADRSEDTPLGTVITISVLDLEDVARRAEHYPETKSTWAKDRSALWLREPGLNVIRVIERNDAAPEAAPSTADRPQNATPEAAGLSAGDLESSAPTTASVAEANFIQDA